MCRRYGRYERYGGREVWEVGRHGIYAKYKMYGNFWRNLYVGGMGDTGGMGCMGGIEI